MADPLVALDPAAARAWRPQTVGSGKFRDVHDPLIEPLWNGTRVLAHIAAGATTMFDDEGAELAEDEIAAAVADSVAAFDAVVDGYLTSDPARTGEGIVLSSGVEAPSAVQMTRQLLIGGSPDRDARVEALRGDEPEPEQLGEHLVFVAVDLLALDGAALLDVPLLERKRLLDAVVAEAELVRLGIHVRPPIDPWLATWRSLGFRSLVYKAANSRYRPGEPNQAWAAVAIPTR
jgi:ATP-dependent DNA ligase